MIVYLLAIASPTHGVPASMYYSGWAGQSEDAVIYRRTWSRTTALGIITRTARPITEKSCW